MSTYIAVFYAEFTEIRITMKSAAGRNFVVEDAQRLAEKLGVDFLYLEDVE